MAGEPLRPLFHDLPHPVHRLHVVLERWAAEEADLRNIRRAQARHAALSLDRLDHRRLFAADVRPRPASQVNGRVRARRICVQLLKFILQDLPATGVFVAQIDIDLADAYRPGRDEHAFQEAVRIALEVPAVLEGARLALVDIDRHQARRGLAGHASPLAADRETGAAQAAQSRVLHDLGQSVAGMLARETVGDELVAAVPFVGGEIDVTGLRAGNLLPVDGFLYRINAGMAHGVLTHNRHGSHFAPAHARRMHHAHALP